MEAKYTNYLADSRRKSISTVPESDLSILFVHHLPDDSQQCEVELYVKGFSKRAETNSGDHGQKLHVQEHCAWKTCA